MGIISILCCKYVIEKYAMVADIRKRIIVPDKILMKYFPIP